MGFDLDTSVTCFYTKLIFFNFYQEVSVVSLTPESSLFWFFFFFGIVLNSTEACFLSIQILFPSTLTLFFCFCPLCSCLDQFHFFFPWKLLHSVGSCPGREPYCICFESSQGLDCSNPFSPPQFRYMVITCFGEKTLWISAPILKTGPLYSPVNIR